MRELLFRGKRLDTGEWIERKTLLTTNGNVLLSANVGAPIYKVMPDYVDDDDENIYGVASTEPLFVPVDPETLGQYTGLKDKNGRKIFEGDIVRSALDGINREIVFVETYAYGWYANSEKYGMESLQEFEKVDGNNNPCIYFCGEVIGNIFDNPELLEVNDEY